MASAFSSASSRWWIISLAIAICLAAGINSSRALHSVFVSDSAGGAELKINESSSTGYENEARKLIIPQRNAGSFQWIMQVQEMFSQGTVRLQQVDYDNAPEGRVVLTPSAYRWWLASVAWMDHKVTGNPIGLSVERAALYADPLIQLVFLVVTVLFIARLFGGWSSAVFALGAVTFFPLSGAFVPGQPGDSSLFLVSALYCVLFLLAGVHRLQGSENGNGKSCRRYFILSGIAGGIAAWIGVGILFVLVFGILISAIVLIVIQRLKSPSEEGTELPWIAWSVAGGIVIALTWLIDRSSVLLAAEAWRSDFVNPLYAVAWIGAGCFLKSLSSGATLRKKSKVIALAVLGVFVVGLVAFIASREGASQLMFGPIVPGLTRLPMNPEATSFGAWQSMDGGNFVLFATLIPVAAFLVWCVGLARSEKSRYDTSLYLLALGPTLLVLVFSFSRLGWWSLFDALVLLGISISISRFEIQTRWSVAAAAGFAGLLGMILVVPVLAKESRESVDRAELETLVERYLAGWLAERTDESGAVVLAPPNVSISLAFYGDLRVVGTPYPENVDGFAAAVRLSAASTADEARALAEGREVEFVVHPTWDTFLEEYARLGSNQPENSFIASLNLWLPPLWLRPVVLNLPKIEGFEEESLVLFRRTEVQTNAGAIARLIEYFLDTGRGQLAMRAHSALENGFPEEIETLLTSVELAFASGDQAMFRKKVVELEESINRGAAQFLDWDLRLSTALVLAAAQRTEAAKELLEESIQDADEYRIRRLPTASNIGMLRLAKHWDIEFSDPSLRQFALSLIPEQSRNSL